MMRLSNDLEEFLELLNSRSVDYVVVGAQSLAFDGRPRYTGDLGILVGSARENAAKLVVPNEFGVSSTGLTEADLSQRKQVVHLGRAPNRIDLLTSLAGVTTEEALRTRISAGLDGVPGFVLAKEPRIANKRAVGRHRI